MREKNVRVRKIIGQLQLSEELVEPSLLPEEQPENLLTVKVGWREGGEREGGRGEREGGGREGRRREGGREARGGRRRRTRKRREWR